MKYLAVVGCLLLAGCGTTGLGSSVSTQQVSAKIKEVQEWTKTICKFVPTVGTIANILSGGQAMPVTAIADAICNAVTTAPLADGGRRTPKVNGVVVKGKFVK